MSFAATTEQVKNRTKTVTRRMGWKFLKPGDLIEAVAKYRGVRVKARERLATIKVTGVHREQLLDIDCHGVECEGFPGWGPPAFVRFFRKMNKCQPEDIVTVIRFKYV